jgi:tetratricopeptide (TPR) repeat protein
MKKKAAQKVKVSPRKLNGNKPIKSMSPPMKSTPGKSPVKAAPKPDVRFTQAVQNFEAGMKALQSQKFDKAKSLLEKVLDGPSRELIDRARMYINVCNQQLAKTTTSFKTPEEHYDYTVALMNNGEYEEARAHLEKIIKQNPHADYGVYGLAVLDALMNRAEDALRNLEQAIKMNPANRYQARNDSDFVNLADDPRFTELIYPEPGEMDSASDNSAMKK